MLTVKDLQHHIKAMEQIIAKLQNENEKLKTENANQNQLLKSIAILN